MAISIIFEIPGKPLGKKDPKPSRRSGLIKEKKTRAEMKRIANLFKAQFPHYPVSEGAFEYKMDIMFPIPKSYSSKKKEDAKSDRIRPTSKPDISNVMKLVEDALEGLVWHNDSQIVSTSCEKWYSDEPKVVIQIKDFE